MDGDAAANANPAGAPAAANPPAAPAAPGVNINDLRNIFLNAKADIPIFNGDPHVDSITPRFMYDRIIIARQTYGWTDEATAGNFKLALRGKAIDWIKYVEDTEEVDVTRWSLIEPHFLQHYDVKIKTVDNVWDFSN